MHPLFRTLLAIPVAIIYVIEAIVLMFVPKSLRYKDISRETVLITGAGSGIGRELAKKFAKFGCRLLLVDINLKGLNETAALLDDAQVAVYECDLSKREKVYEMAAKIKDEMGSVTILVNNAGIVTGKKFLDCPDDMIQKTMEVNVMAHFWTCKAFLPDMVEMNHGHIVSVASVAGIVGVPRQVDYCASKFAAVGFEQALNYELYASKLTGIKTTVVQPYQVHTGLFDGFRIKLLDGLTPEYVAQQIISGVLVDQEVIIIPSILALPAMLFSLMPRKASRHIMDKSGIMNCMDNFTGRVANGH